MHRHHHDRAVDEPSASTRCTYHLVDSVRYQQVRRYWRAVVQDLEVRVIPSHIETKSHEVVLVVEKGVLGGRTPDIDRHTSASEPACARARRRSRPASAIPQAAEQCSNTAMIASSQPDVTAPSVRRIPGHPSATPAEELGFATLANGEPKRLTKATTPQAATTNHSRLLSPPSGLAGQLLDRLACVNHKEPHISQRGTASAAKITSTQSAGIHFARMRAPSHSPHWAPGAEVQVSTKMTGQSRVSAPRRRRGQPRPVPEACRREHCTTRRCHHRPSRRRCRRGRRVKVGADVHAVEADRGGGHDAD